MKTVLLSTIIIAGLSATSVAAQVDTNGDGILTLDEVNAAFPDIKAEEFSAMDANADGVLDNDEVAAAQDAGLMPKT
ncbi:MAG: hypothetical protein L3J36_10990 [Rhodobacteraceae bacterium]|nr:hypothetical protein [Paracoccaceae bacterium]